MALATAPALTGEFKIDHPFDPAGDQPQAIEKLTEGILERGYTHQTLMGVTGSGKTFAMAGIVERVQRPTLVIAHNKTLAAQLATEFQEYFPHNSVQYFVSYYDYYQPEAYIPRSDMYIEKETDINEEIDRLRHAATRALMTRRDVLIVASVSCIYGMGSPQEYSQITLNLRVGDESGLERIKRRLIAMYYERNDMDLRRGRFRVKGDVIDIHPADEEIAVRIEFFGDDIESIRRIDPLTGEILNECEELDIYPGKHFITPEEEFGEALREIEQELDDQLELFRNQGKLLEAERLEQRTNFDLEMLREAGTCAGIENYSQPLGRRPKGSAPWTLLDYFPEDYLLFIDECHMTIPQISGMFHGDRARKDTLVDHGFRLPSARDNRPLTFQEFEERVYQVVYVSATPGESKDEHSDYGESGEEEFGDLEDAEESEEHDGLAIDDDMPDSDRGTCIHCRRRNAWISANSDAGEVGDGIATPDGLLGGAQASSADGGLHDAGLPTNGLVCAVGVEELAIDDLLSEGDDVPDEDDSLEDEDDALEDEDDLPEEEDDLPEDEDDAPETPHRSPLSTYAAEHEQQRVEMINRPTGLVDPEIEVMPVEGQIDDLHERIRETVAKRQRVLVTTLTKRMAEDLTDYLREFGVRVQYLHSEIDTLRRMEILRDLRLGVYDVVVGINLLREGLDLPEVSLVAILDADKEGYLRSGTSLIQTIGRAARHVEGKVVMYCDNMTESLRFAIDETNRRREIQTAYNSQHGIVPVSVEKGIHDITERVSGDDELLMVAEDSPEYGTAAEDLPKDELLSIVKDLEKQMKRAATELEFELAASLRDQLTDLRKLMASRGWEEPAGRSRRRSRRLRSV